MAEQLLDSPTGNGWEHGKEGISQQHQMLFSNLSLANVPNHLVEKTVVVQNRNFH